MSGQPATLLGYPVIEAEDMPDVAANSLSIAFGNFKAGYMIAERKRRRSCAIRSPTSPTSISTRLLTFEVLGDATDPTIGAILADASEGLIQSDAPEICVHG